MEKRMNEDTLAQLITRGGIYYAVPGADKKEIVSNLIDNLKGDGKPLPSSISETLLKAVMEREALISTGMENGIALPHPRTPMLEEGEEPFVAMAFPSQPVDWQTADNSKVHTVFLIVSKSPKQHLGVLSKINVLCQDKSFLYLICNHAPKEKIIAAIEEAEKDWR
jgi:PTS system nitrogen regulatory IIA component